MDKNAIKKFAVWARKELISRVMQKALTFGIWVDSIKLAGSVTIDDKPLTDTQRMQRGALVLQIQQKGYQHVMEDVAYTWFNRFIALRFMEVNGYLPSRVRVFTDENGKFNPQIIDEAIHLDLDGLDMEKVYAFKETNQTGALYRYLLITQCNALSKLLPQMFQPLADYTELLLPDNLLREGSVIEQMVTMIPEEDWQDQVQIIGWLYQYYNTEPKDQVFADLKKNIKISKDKIPAATQLFTPDWIVRYMVENSLGRLWLEGHPNEALKVSWKYYLDEAEQEPAVQEQLAKIRAGYAAIRPEDIRVIDPCMGSGHILVYMFDVLVQIYEDYGYTTREAVESIIQHNLYGLDIDDRAAQLAYFAVMMKARQYDRRFLSRKDEDGNPNIPQPHVHTIVESNGIDRATIKLLGAGMPGIEYNSAVTQMNALLDALNDAKEYGSILTVEELDWALLRRFVAAGASDAQVSLDTLGLDEAMARLPGLIDVGEALASHYDAVVTNPPYMGVSGMGDKLSKFVKDNYPDSKSDLFAVFIERCGQMTKPNAFHAMITQHAWMFLSSFEKLRGKLLKVDTVNMAHLGARAFEEIGGEVVQTTSFVMRNSSLKAYKGVYCRLIEPTTQQGKEDMFLVGEKRFAAQQDNFSKIPGAPVAYWVSEKVYTLFMNCKNVRDITFVGIGMRTGDNDRFLRYWHEVPQTEICLTASNKYEAQQSGAKWFSYNKGGEKRRWYGNNEYVVNWENDGEEIKDNTRKNYPQLGDNLGWKISNEGEYFKPLLTWTFISSNGFGGVRYKDAGFICDVQGSMITGDESTLLYLAGVLCSKVTAYLLSVINPTMSIQVKDIAMIPVVSSMNDYVECIVKKCIQLEKQEWNEFEYGWDFQQHPLIQYARWTPSQIAIEERKGMHSLDTMETAYHDWAAAAEARFQQLKANEEELNRIFIDIYGLQDELTPDVDEKDVTVRRADLGRDVRSFISYAVGCMLGRYSIYEPGLMYAGGEWDYNKYEDAAWRAEGKPEALDFYNRIHFTPDVDGILPICDDEYFDDDIVGRFIEFVAHVYGTNTLDQNLAFIAKALGGKGTPREVIRSYFLNDFYKDHLKIYQKRPIYWLFDSGKKNGFKCLIYMHRYAPDTIARIRTDYVHEQQSRYRTAIASIEGQLNGASSGERVRLNKRLQTLQAQAEEIRLYEEKIHHLADQMISIDLDDGVKHNYEIFKAVLAPIK